MKDHDGDVKEFTHLSRAWYGAANLTSGAESDRVTFGFYSPEGGTSGELAMVWIPLSHDKPSAKLECFEDAFHTLAQFTDVIERLGEVDGDNIQPLDFCALLTSCGFTDTTPEKSPYTPPPITCPTCGTEGVKLPAR